MAGYVDVRAYAELNDFLGPESRGVTVRRPFQPHQTVKDVLEAMGIPHTEVDLILVNGNAEGFAHRPTSGDRITAYPMFEALDIGSTARLRPVPLRDPRLVIDVNLGRLALLLRVLGFDVWWSSDADDQTLADVSLGQQRILLTRDRALLKRRAITHANRNQVVDPDVIGWRCGGRKPFCGRGHRNPARDHLEKYQRRHRFAGTNLGIDEFIDHIARNVSEPEVTAAVTIGEFGMVDS